MKIRIKGNSLRIRLSRPEVNKLAAEGYLEEETCFGNKSLVYALQTTPDAGHLSAEFVGDKITMFVPAPLINGWQQNEIVGFDATMLLGEKGNLYLLLEKDFVCIDATTEDQADNYENPKKNC